MSGTLLQGFDRREAVICLASSSRRPYAIHDHLSPAGVVCVKQGAQTTWRSSRMGRSILSAGRPLVQRHALVAKFLHRPLVLGKMRQPHAAQDVWRFGELDVVVADDLYAIAPGV